MPLVIRRDYALHYYGFIDFPSLLWSITINLDDFVSSLKFNPLLLTRLFSLTRMLFKSQQISFMLTLRSKVIHPRLKNLPKRDRNQLDLKKKKYIYIYINLKETSIHVVPLLSFWTGIGKSHSKITRKSLTNLEKEKNEVRSYCSCPRKWFKCLWSENLVIKFLFSWRGQKNFWQGSESTT